MPFEVPGYLAGWESPFPAHLVSDGQAYEIHIAVKSKSTQPEEKTMLHEGILARMGRLLAAIASQTIDNAESNNKVALVKQAIREIDAGADEARYALGKSRAEEFRLKRRREELDAEAARLDEKIRLAIAENRDDLARAGVARQIDLESQGIALERAMDFIELEIEEQTKALQAMLGARREAEVRLADLEAKPRPAVAGTKPAGRLRDQDYKCRSRHGGDRAGHRRSRLQRARRQGTGRTRPVAPREGNRGAA